MAMAELSAATQRRITFLAAFDTLGGDYDAAIEVVEKLTEDGRFFDGGGSRPTPQRSERSARPASNSRPSSRGRDQRGGGGFNGNMRDPDGPPTEKQVGLLLRLTDDYSSDEVWEMTKAEVSALIEDLKN